MLQDYCITVSAYGFTVLTLGQSLLFLQGKIAISDVTVLSDIFSDVTSLDVQTIVQQSSNE